MAERSGTTAAATTGDGASDAGGAGQAPRFTYAGPKDLGRAESLYRSALTKPDPDYAAQLLFSAIAANPEHAPAVQAVLARALAHAAKNRRMVVRISDLLAGGPADAFVQALAAYCAAPAPDAALACAAEAVRAGLAPYAAALGERLLQAVDAKEWAAPKAAAMSKLTDVLESAGALPLAARAAREAVRLYPDEQAFREREKNLLARRYMRETDLASAPSFQKTLKAKAEQDALHRPTDHAARLDALEQRYRQSHSLDDFRELVRGLRDAYPQRREAALPTLQDGLARFSDRDTRWLVREIGLERKWAEVRLAERVVAEQPAAGGTKLAADLAAMRAEALAEQAEHLYEVVGSLPPDTPDRHRRELELARTLLDAGRHEEAIKQAQAVKRRPEHRLDAWVVMARAFVRLGWTPEAGECFEQILADLRTGAYGSAERVLEAKYSYAEFLVDEAAKRRDPALARQARKLCSDVMIEDIDYRAVRRLAARADAVAAGLE